jgi:hypothetical protein
MNCKYCGKSIKQTFLNKLLRIKYCNNKCFEKREEEYENKRLKAREDSITRKEQESNDIRIKYITLDSIYEEQEVLLNLVNKWKINQSETLKILNIETYHIDSNYLDQCEPWTAKIIYTFDNCEPRMASQS